MPVTEPEFRGDHVSLGEGSLFCVSAGEGEPLLLLHGALGTGCSHFSRQLPVFAAEFHVIAPDLRGYGASAPRRFTPDFYYEDAADAAALLHALGQHPAHVLGFSDGGIVALCLALKYPELVRSLTVVASQAYVDRVTWEAVRGWLPPESLPEKMRESLAQFHGAERWQALVADYVAVTTALWERGGDVCAHRLSEVRCPTLVVHGGKDQWVIPEHPEMLRTRIPGARYVVLPEAGHYVQKDCSDAFNALTLAFLRSQRSG